jgi:putative glutamine amidotransferase
MSQRIAVSMRRMISEYCEEREAISCDWSRFLKSFLPGRIWAPAPSLADEKDMLNFLNGFGFDGIIFSGGEDWGKNTERDAAETAAFNWTRINKVPALGICRGAQVINRFMGGGLSSVSGHRAVRHLVEASGSHFEVNSYHSKGITSENLASGLSPLAFADDGSIEAFRLNDAPVVGLMWHPERENTVCDFDRDILFNLFGA